MARPALGSPEAAEILPEVAPLREELEPHLEALRLLDLASLEWVLVRLEPQDPLEQGLRPPS